MLRLSSTIRKSIYFQNSRLNSCLKIYTGVWARNNFLSVNVENKLLYGLYCFKAAFIELCFMLFRVCLSDVIFQGILVFYKVVA